ncbi:NnrU family protein [Thiohalocapsa sp. ML1]|jgi:uncharacterized membrane protein|uniref:NnrU family protein n=1 Tax=Thiohalocapsa sp. ML1 TaxID=1431688 RepID=UPI0007323A75|nr:NnrU family protein [Thiohalocapsa sp. ML1]
MLQLMLGLALFLGAHSIAIVRPDWRRRALARFGEVPWKLVYSLVSVLGVVLIVLGYGAMRADPIVLYQSPTWLRHVALLLMLPVFPLVLAAYLPGRIQSTLKHPMLVAVKLWAVAHLLANGTLADLLLFGGFLAWAVVDRVSLKRRAAAPVPGAPAGKWNDWIALVAGVALYVAFLLFLHRWLFGVAPIG